MEVLDGRVVLTDEEKERCKSDWRFQMHVAFRKMSEDCLHGKQVRVAMIDKKENDNSGEIVTSWPICKNTCDFLFFAGHSVIGLSKDCCAEDISRGREKRCKIAKKIKSQIQTVDKMTDDKYKIWELIHDDIRRIINTE